MPNAASYPAYPGIGWDERIHTMTLDVVGAGFGGAGTLSLKLALEQLGFAPCHHMVEANKTPASLACWDAADGNPDWDKIYAGHRTTVDLLGTTFYAELAAYYPEAKVILTERDPQVWYESTQATIFKHLRALKARDPDHPFARMTDKVIGRLFGFGPGSPPSPDLGLQGPQRQGPRGYPRRAFADI